MAEKNHVRAIFMAAHWSRWIKPSLMFAYYSDYLQIGRSLAAIISAPCCGRIRLQFDECLARVGPVTSPAQAELLKLAAAV